MSHAENPDLTTLRFIDNWNLQNPQRLVAELVSVHKETHRKPDIYHFEVRDGLLIDPETKEPILNFIAPGIEKGIAENLQSWAIKNEEGVAYWISPRLEGVYPCNKIIIHNIAYTQEGEKIVLNSAILFDGNLENPEELRKTLFYAEDTPETFSKILTFIEEVSRQKINKVFDYNEEIVRSQAEYFARQIKMGVTPSIVVEEMQKNGFLGKNSISCRLSLENQTFSSFLDSKSLISIFTSTESSPSGYFECPNCKGLIPSGRGITKCPHCGITKEEYGSRCD